jgi:flagellar basal-body rod protein FlgF
MQGGFYSGTGGMVAQFTKLETVTNNLANLNSAGFKKDNNIFGDYLRVAQEKHDDLPLKNQTKDGARFYHRATTRVPQVVDQYSDFSLGTVKQTNNQLDLALSEPDIFFVVESPEGFMLTRDGSFKTNSNGEIVTKDGFPVLNSNLRPIELDMQEKTTFDKSGSFINGANEGSLLIVRPENLRLLEKQGSGLYKVSDDNELISAEDQMGVVQGYLETSNVNAVVEMTSMIEANRMVGMYQKVMDTHMNQLNRDAIEKLGANRG